MDNVNPVEADKLFEGVPWEAWNEVTAGPDTVKRFGGIDGFKRAWLTNYDWVDDGWKPKRKNE
jgi:hypothetical protein